MAAGTEIEEFNWDRDTHRVIHAFLRSEATRRYVSHTLFQHPIESFNHMMNIIIPRLFEQHLTITEEYVNPRGDKLRYEIQCSYHSTKPAIHELDNSVRFMYPGEAERRNLTYSAPIYLHMKHRVTGSGVSEGGGEGGSEDVVDGTWWAEGEREDGGGGMLATRIPVMVHSDHCHLKGLSEDALLELGESPLDVGGHFIINGNSKVVIPQERTAENIYTCFEQGPDKKESAKCEIRSTINQFYHLVRPASVYMRRSDRTFWVKVYNIKEAIPLFIVFRALGIQTDREIFDAVFMGQLDNLEGVSLLGNSARQEGVRVASQQEALKYMAQYLNFNRTHLREKDDPESIQIEHLRRLIQVGFLPHVGTSFSRKAINLAYMTRRLIQCLLGERQYDDRDHLKNKRLDLVGPLMIQIVRSNLISLEREIRKRIQEHLEKGQVGPMPSLRKIVSSNQIENRLIYALSTGVWTLSKRGGAELGGSKKGIAQIRKSLSHLDTITHMRRLKSPLEQKRAKLTKPRMFHSSQLGHNCMPEVPEGQEVGTVKNLATSAHVTIDSDPNPVRSYVFKLGAERIETLSPDRLAMGVLVFVNGDLLGCVPNEHALKFYYGLKVVRRHSKISRFISICWNYEHSEIVIETGGGRYCRPFYIVEGGQPLVSRLWRDPDFRSIVSRTEERKLWQLFTMPKHGWPGSSRISAPTGYTLSNGCVVEYLDVAEQECSMVADLASRLVRNTEIYASRDPTSYYMRYTHLELHPSLWNGVMAATIPAADHQQAPRVVYQSSMGKQGISIYHPLYYLRLDTTGNVLLYPQRPLFNTRIMHYLGMTMIHQGMVSMVACMIHGGHNQEDSLLAMQSAFERGYFNSLYFRTYETEQITKGHTSRPPEFFGVPPEEAHLKDSKQGRERALKELVDPKTGFPKMGVRVSAGDPIIMKYSKLKDDPRYSHKDLSITVRNGESGIVDLVVPDPADPDPNSNVNENGHRICKARVTELRIPQEGDKFASRQAQKGTDGKSYRQEDMPFNGSGVVAEKVLNAHAWPSRMTISLIPEFMGNKAALRTGQYYDGTAFIHTPLDAYQEILERDGLQGMGDELMYSGKTGEMLNTECLFGPCYYQRLKHMVKDKMHSRARGPVQLLTHQPAEGRARDGGLRLGEMERDCLIAHGVPSVIKERFMDSSDLFRMYVSRKHQTFVQANPDRNFYQYGGKDIVGDDVVEVQIPYAAKLFWQELTSVGLDIRFEVEEHV